MEYYSLSAFIISMNRLIKMVISCSIRLLHVEEGDLSKDSILLFPMINFRGLISN